MLVILPEKSENRLAISFNIFARVCPSVGGTPWEDLHTPPNRMPHTHTHPSHSYNILFGDESGTAGE